MQKLLHKSLRLATTMFAVLCASTAWGEFIPINLTFSGRGESSYVQSVTVTNLTHPEIDAVTLSGTNILCLADPSDMQTPIESVEELKVISEPILTPNPSFGDGTLIFDAQQDGPVRVSVYTSGGMLIDAATLNVTKGRNTARIPSQATGVYIVNIEGQGVKNSTRWICSGGKSFGGISLGGAQQWSDVTLPTKTVFRSPSQNRVSADVVVMPFYPGDVLRFEGTSGKMRTILHTAPEVSSAVTFDFFKCEDVNGYNYPIVRSGDMLWMLEDLRPQTMDGIISVSNAANWKAFANQVPAEYVSNGKAYYNIQAGRMALPEGWRMPSVDEVHAYVKELKADVKVLGDFLKDRDYNWSGSLTAGPDTIHMLLQPNGFVDQTGKLTDNTKMGAWLTRNTINHGCPVTFEVKADTAEFYPQVTHEMGCGFTVRGCRIAPTVYQEMIDEFFTEAAAARAFKASEQEEEQEEQGLVGAYYSYAGTNRKALFLDYSFNQYNADRSEKRSGVFGDFGNGSSELISKGMVPWGINGSDSLAHLRKAAPQANAEGCDNIVYASWSRPFRVHTDGKKQVKNHPSVVGEGVVYVTIFGDRSKNHDILEGYSKRPLLNADGNEYKWEFLYAPVIGYKTLSGSRLCDIASEYYARKFNIKCIQDQTGDGIGEIVMQVDYKIAVFDGATLRCIREKDFYKAEPSGRLWRFDIADVDCDGNEDIIAIEGSSGSPNLDVFSKGHIDEAPKFSAKVLGVGSTGDAFYDVKVGNFSNHQFPDIAVIRRHYEVTPVMSKTGNLFFYRLEYENFDPETRKPIGNPTLLKYFEAEPDAWASNSDLANRVGNMNLCFAYFRGRQYPADLIVGDGLWRYDFDQEKPVFKQIVLEAAKTNYITIPADAIVSVRFHEKTDKESLFFVYDNLRGSGKYTATGSAIGEVYLGDDNKFHISIDLNKYYFGFAKSGPYWENENYEMTKNANISAGVEYATHPVLCEFNDREQVKHFKFVKHEMTLSEPRIYAAIAAAPYYMGLAKSDGASTTWGKANSQGTSTSTSDTWGGSVIVGYEYDFTVPFIAKGGVEFTTKVSASASVATGHEKTLTYAESYSAEQEHAIVMQALPFDTYTYEITGSSDPDDIGMTFQVSAPRSRVFIPLALQDYVKLVGSQRGVASPQKFLTSTPGDPFSYPKNYDDIQGVIRNNDKYPFLKGRNVNNQETTVAVGTAGATSRSIGLEINDSKTTSVEIGVETELVATVNGVKAGVGFNYNQTNETTHTIGKELTVGGTVPGLPSGTDDDYHPTFRWNIVWYYVKDANGEIYPVVNYIVTR